VDPALDVLYVTWVRYENEGGFMNSTCREETEQREGGREGG